MLYCLASEAWTVTEYLKNSSKYLFLNRLMKGQALGCLKYGCDTDSLICSFETCEETDFCKCSLILLMLSSCSLIIPSFYHDKFSPHQQKWKAPMAPNGLVDNDIFSTDSSKIEMFLFYLCATSSKFEVKCPKVSEIEERPLIHISCVFCRMHHIYKARENLQSEDNLRSS